VIGLLLLAMRINVAESTLHEKLMSEAPDVARGNIMIFFRQPKLLRKLLKVIWVGGPIWATSGLLIIFAPEFAKAINMTVIPTAANAVLYYFIGFSIGAFLIGWVSQYLRSRRKALALWLVLLSLTVVFYFAAPRGDAVWLYYLACGFLGVGAGYWAMFIQIGAEQFGTNIRATAATCAPNFVRGLTIPYTAAFHVLVPALGVVGSGTAVVGIAIVIAFIALARLQETFGKNLDFQDI
jgi:MFS family permease